MTYSPSNDPDPGLLEWIAAAIAAGVLIVGLILALHTR